MVVVEVVLLIVFIILAIVLVLASSSYSGVCPVVLVDVGSALLICATSLAV